MNIGFDLDGVLADFNSRFIERIIEITGEDKFPPRPFDIPTWHYPQVYGYTDEQMDLTNGPVWTSIRHDPTFWAMLPAYSWTANVLRRLHALQHEHAIYFITDRTGATAKQQTESWLRNYNFDRATVLISSQKALCAQALKLDVYVDDRYENTESVGATSSTTQTFLLTRPWNVTYPPGHYQRIDSPLDVFKILAL